MFEWHYCQDEQQLQKTNQNFKMTGQKRQAGAEFTKPTYVNPFSDNSIAIEKKNTRKKSTFHL